MDQAADLLIEIGCEDLPARFVRPLASALAQGVVGGLDERRVTHGPERVFATPRRIAVLVEGVARRQPPSLNERRGPRLEAAFKDGQATPAAEGFARSCGVDVGALKQEGGQLVFRQRQAGQNTAVLIPEVFAAAIKRMDTLVPKRMRWGEGEETFVRPVHWIVALLGGKVIRIERFGVQSGRRTCGHRFHAPKAIGLKKPDDYQTALLAAKVQADWHERRAVIVRGVLAEARRIGGQARATEALLDEVTALVEWPVVFSGRIEDRFLQLPPEVVVATVETNQRYFTVFSEAPSVEGQMKSADGYLKPAFITVANIESRDLGQVIAGNERVVRPRLADALFFWEQDRKQSLEAFAAKLDSVTFQKDLGTVGEKVRRVAGLAASIATQLKLSSADAGDIRQAAELCKSDLVTNMVFEFPELQGLMGGYYARAAGKSEEVAAAIAEHYRPTQAGGSIPSTTAGRVVALADKLDTLAGIFAIGQKPTASKDPFALRRAALGAARIVIEGGLKLNLQAMASEALRAQPVDHDIDEVCRSLWEFIVDRLRGYCLDRGVAAEQFEAVKAVGTADLADFEQRLQALQAFLPTPEAASLAAAAKRARNILRQAEPTRGVPAELRLERFEAAEQSLHEQFERVEELLRPLRDAADYEGMLRVLAGLKAPVDAFFDGVMVMAEDPVLRNNRIALLSRLDRLSSEVADLSLLPG